MGGRCLPAGKGFRVRLVASTFDYGSEAPSNGEARARAGLIEKGRHPLLCTLPLSRASEVKGGS